MKPRSKARVAVWEIAGNSSAMRSLRNVLGSRGCGRAHHISRRKGSRLFGQKAAGSFPRPLGNGGERDGSVFGLRCVTSFHVSSFLPNAQHLCCRALGYVFVSGNCHSARTSHSVLQHFRAIWEFSLSNLWPQRCEAESQSRTFKTCLLKMSSKSSTLKVTFSAKMYFIDVS